MNYESELSILEIEHLKTQPYAWPHTQTHWRMLKLAFKYRQWGEFFGQIPRLILAAPGSWTGRAPKGNVGSTKMGIFEVKK